MEGNRSKESLVSIGRIIKPFGVRGEVAVEILTDFPRRFIEMEELFLVNEKSDAPPIKVFVESARFHSKRVLLKLDIINTPEEMEPYRNCFLKIEKSESYQLPPDEFYIWELMGMEVFTVSNDFLGNVTKVFPAGAHDIYQVTHPQTGKVNMIPACKVFVKNIDKGERKITVEPIEGLIDL